MMLQTIEKSLELFPRKEHRLANWVLKNSESIPDLSIKAFAKAASVSEPTVVRFCQRIQCKGYRDFKMKLARALARGESLVHTNPQDPINHKEFALSQDCEAVIKNTFQTISTDVVHSFIQKLATARCVLIVYDRMSQPIADLAFNALYPLIKNVQKAPLTNSCVAGASLMNKNDVVIAFQQNDHELLETLTAAKTKKTHICVIGKATAASIDTFLGIETNARDLPLSMELSALISLNRIVTLLPLISNQAQKRLSHFDSIQATAPKTKMLQGELW